ncbi:hypothetical protein D3C71_1288040 [compost metagenome]
MPLREGAADEALGTHVGKEPRQAVMQRTAALLLVHPATPALQRHDASERRGLAGGIDLDNRHFAAHTLDVPGCHVHLRARSAHLQDLRAANERCQRARGGGLADAQPRLQLGARGGALRTDEGEGRGAQGRRSGRWHCISM